MSTCLQVVWLVLVPGYNDEVRSARGSQRVSQRCRHRSLLTDEDACGERCFWFGQSASDVAKRPPSYAAQRVDGPRPDIALEDVPFVWVRDECVERCAP